MPDLSVYLLDRIPTNADGKVADDFWVPPDLAIEIASPGQSTNWLADRANLLLSAGARVVMVIEPRQEQVRIARHGQPITTYRGEDVIAIEDILPGFAFVARELFDELQVRRPEA